MRRSKGGIRGPSVIPSCGDNEGPPSRSACHSKDRYANLKMALNMSRERLNNGEVGASPIVAVPSSRLGLTSILRAGEILPTVRRI